MKARLRFYFKQNKGFTLPEILLTLVLFALVSNLYFQVEKEINNHVFEETLKIDQFFHLETALNSMEELIRRSDQITLLNKTSRYSQGLRLNYMENEVLKTATFRLEYFTGIISQTIQVNNNSGTSQLAIDIGELIFILKENKNGRLLQIQISGKKNKYCCLERTYFLRGMRYDKEILKNV